MLVNKRLPAWFTTPVSEHQLDDLRLVDDGVRITGTIHHLLRGQNLLPVTFAT